MDDRGGVSCNVDLSNTNSGIIGSIDRYHFQLVNHLDLVFPFPWMIWLARISLMMRIP
uniref:Uncharacterized protein n=2 Tax=Picea TaxID=3328 RepID=A0A101LXN3_PICGL|nr:hypothetical protein ABT39_MTgene6059 [Picea glauca]QHR91432.1 hypothetical protein Q903MT_gene5466 [Picea sitchensis]